MCHISTDHAPEQFAEEYPAENCHWRLYYFHCQLLQGQIKHAKVLSDFKTDSLSNVSIAV
jgi:hypothetical protein